MNRSRSRDFIRRDTRKLREDRKWIRTLRTWEAQLKRLPRRAARSAELRKQLRETLGVIIVMEHTVPTYLRWVPK